MVKSWRRSWDSKNWKTWTQKEDKKLQPWMATRLAFESRQQQQQQQQQQGLFKSSGQSCQEGEGQAGGCSKEERLPRIASTTIVLGDQNLARKGGREETQGGGQALAEISTEERGGGQGGRGVIRRS